MKERFEEMELELITFGASDVIATSGGVNQYDGPDYLTPGLDNAGGDGEEDG